MSIQYIAGLSASILARIQQCPGSFWLAAGYPYTTSEAAERGTLLHDVMQGKVNMEELTSEEIEACEWCLEQVARLETEWDCEPDYTRLELSAKTILTVRGEATARNGRIDRYAYSPENKTALVVDYKFGRIAVDPAAENAQCADYALAVKQTWPEIEKVVAVILQPFVSRNPMAFEFTAFANIEAALTNIADSAMFPATMSDGEGGTVYMPAFRTGPACGYCPARFACPAQAGAAYTAHRKHAGPDKSLDNIPDAVLTENLDMLAPLSKLFYQFREVLSERLKAMPEGSDIAGWRISVQAGARAIEDAQAAYELLCATMKQEDFMRFVKVKLTDLLETVARERYEAEKARYQVVENEVQARCKAAEVAWLAGKAGTGPKAPRPVEAHIRREVEAEMQLSKPTAKMCKAEIEELLAPVTVRGEDVVKLVAPRC